MTIIADTREPKGDGYYDSTETLIVGDFIIKSDTDNSVKFVIERKEIKDLSSSIQDSRFREQRTRLLESFPRDRIVYVIEGAGKLSKGRHLLPESTLDKAMNNLVFVHNVKLVHTRNFEATLELLRYLDTVENVDTVGTTEFTPVKKSSKACDNPLVFQLRTIQGVSDSMAKSIQEKWKTTGKLLEAFSIDKCCLVGLQAGSKKIGKITCEKIRTAFF